VPTFLPRDLGEQVHTRLLRDLGEQVHNCLPRALLSRYTPACQELWWAGGHLLAKGPWQAGMYASRCVLLEEKSLDVHTGQSDYLHWGNCRRIPFKGGI
jgi:hypothetical protein